MATMTSTPAARNCGVNAVSAGTGPRRSSPRARSSPDHRLDHLDFFAAQVPGLARVRIEPEHRDARRFSDEMPSQIRVHDLSVARSRSAVMARGTSASGRWVVTSATPQRAASLQHHDRQRRARARRRDIRYVP